MKELLKNGKNILFACIGIIAILISLFLMNYTIDSRWLKLSRSSSEKDIHDYKNKFKVQYAYSIDMKEAMINKMSVVYEKALRDYIVDNGIKVSEQRIREDVNYYRLITSAISSEAEDITVDRFILTNDLHRYTDNKDWDTFKEAVLKKFMLKGNEVVRKYYEENKTIMSINDWYRYGGVYIERVVNEETNCLLDNLKTESVLYHNLASKRGG